MERFRSSDSGSTRRCVATEEQLTADGLLNRVLRHRQLASANDKFHRFAGSSVPIMLMTAGERFHNQAELDVPLWWPSAGSFACVRRTERFRPRGFGRTTRPRGFGRHGVPSIEVGLRHSFSGCARPHPFCSGLSPTVQGAMVRHEGAASGSSS